MEDPNDIARIKYVIFNPDNISGPGVTRAYTHQRKGKARPAPTVLYEKNIGEKSYYVVQAVPDTKAKTLYIVSAFIGESGYKKEASQLINASNGPDATAKTGSVVASKNSIRSAEPIVKPESTEKRSDRDPTAAATTQELEADVADLRELLSLQGDVTRKDSHILSAAQYLSTYHGVIGKQDPKIHKELARLLKDFYSYLDTSEDLSWDNIAEKAKPVAEWIFKHTEAGRQKSEFARNVLADIRSKQIRLTEAERVQAAEGYGFKTLVNVKSEWMMQ